MAQIRREADTSASESWYAPSEKGLFVVARGTSDIHLKIVKWEEPRRTPISGYLL